MPHAQLDYGLQPRLSMLQNAGQDHHRPALRLCWNSSQLLCLITTYLSYAPAHSYAYAVRHLSDTQSK